MQFPSMKSNPKYTLRVPSFDGGINTSLLPQNIRDNQAVSMTNMWFKDGALQTRPSFKSISELISIYESKENKWHDLNTDIKIGFQSYDENSNLIGDTESYKYKLLWTGHRLNYYYINGDSASYIEVPLVFSDPFHQRCYELGRAVNVFFFSGSSKTKQLTMESGEYKQVFYTEVRGYITIESKGIGGLEKLEDKPIKLFFYLAPTLDGDKVQASFEVFNVFKDIPEEYQPYQPIVITNYDTPYAEFNEDINLLHDKFLITRDVNNDISKLGTTDYEKIEPISRGFGDGAGEYGNENRWEVFSTSVPAVGESALSRFVVYGKFEIKQYETINWTEEDQRNHTNGNNIPVGVYIKTETVITGTDSDGNTEYKGKSESKTVATAEKIVFTRRKDNPENFDAVYYNAAGESLQPDDIRDENGDVLPLLCSGRAWAEIKSGELKVIFPKSVFDFKSIVFRDFISSRDSYVSIKPTTCTLFDSYIDNIEYYCFTKDHNYETEAWEQQNQSDLITKNNIKIWYGGTNSGYADGTRLFVAGHPEFGNVLRWSDVNNSSYFPENNFAYIGRDDEKITALNKQDGYMVVFKEHETYAIDYAFTTDETNNTIVYFPVSAVSPYIGCDCPGSIQLISNRLTWLSSNGKVNVLYSQNSHSERNIREISQHIETELKQFSTSELQNAKSADYDNKYFIFIGKTAYIWDYDRNPYYNYTSSEQAQSRLCWYKWELPYQVEDAYIEDNELYIAFSEYNNFNPDVINNLRWHQTSKLYQEADKDDSIKHNEYLPITTKFKSKLFNFDKPFVWKKIDRAFFELENVIKKDGVRKQYHTGDIYFYFYSSDNEDKATTIVTNKFTESEVNTYSTRPYIKRVKNIGFCVESECPIKLLTAEISAELYGEVK